MTSGSGTARPANTDRNFGGGTSQFGVPHLRAAFVTSAHVGFLGISPQVVVLTLDRRTLRTWSPGS